MNVFVAVIFKNCLLESKTEDNQGRKLMFSKCQNFKNEKLGKLTVTSSHLLVPPKLIPLQNETKGRKYEARATN